MLRSLWPQTQLRANALAIVGDRLYTNVAMVHRVGAFGVFMLTGKTHGDQANQHLPSPNLIVPTLAEFGLQLRAVHQPHRAL